MIQHREQHEARSLEPTPEAEAEWVATIKQKAIHSQWFQRECTPGYYNNEGMPEEGTGFRGSNMAADQSSSTTSFASGAQKE